MIPGSVQPRSGPASCQVLLSTRPERERASVAAALALALAAHGLLALASAAAGPLGGEWHPAPSAESSEGESTVLLLLLPGAAPGTRAPTARARIVRPSPVPVLIAPTGVPSAIPIPPPGAPGGASAPAAIEPAPVWRRFLPAYAAPLTPPAPEAMTDAARAQVRVGRKLGDVVDSIVAADAARRQFRDWEVGKGSPWGFTPEGRPRLGPIPVPEPLKAELATAPGLRERARRERANWSDVQRSAARAETRAIVDERIRALRERRARERADSAVAHRR